MFKILILTLWNALVSALVCIAIIKLLLYSAVQREFDSFKEKFGIKAEKKYKYIKKRHLSKNGLRNLKKKIFD